MSTPVEHEVVLEAKEIQLSFGGIKALQGVGIRLHAGEWCGLVGPNGSGKSSTLNVLSGFYKPQSGTVLYERQDVAGLAPNHRRRAGIARTFQHPVLSSRLSLSDNVRVSIDGKGGRSAGRHAVRESALTALAEMECGELAAQPASAVAYGIRKRVEIARALASEPKILLLDEPAAGLSPPERTAVIASLHKLRESMPQLSAIIVEHDVSFVSRLCESVVALDFGKVLAAGATQAVINDPKVRSVFLGEAADDE